MNARMLLLGCFAAIASPVLALDFTAMEAMVAAAKAGSSAQAPTEQVCDNADPRHAGASAPSGFDFCHPSRQMELAEKGLYLTVDGAIKPLPAELDRAALVSEVILPTLKHEDVESLAPTPFVLDLEAASHE